MTSTTWLHGSVRARCGTLGIVLMGAALSSPPAFSQGCPQFTSVHTRTYYGPESGWPNDSTSGFAYPVSNSSGFAYLRNSTLPLSPDSSKPCVQVPPGFASHLWASERSPGGGTRSMVAMTWDERGRLWGVETRDYPNRVLANPLPGGGGLDRVVILEDTNGDGLADTRKVFAEGYNLLTGIVHTVHGVVLSMAPHILLLKDENGDDVADNPQGQILYTGFGRNDTHATLSNLFYGVDNWIYASVGYSNTTTVTSPSASQTFTADWTQRIIRFKSDGTSIQSLTNVSNNAWGIGISENGHIFASTANRDHSFHQVYPGAERKTPIYSGADQTYMPQSVLKSGAGAWAHPRPITHHVNINNGGFPAASNHSLYTARHFPRKYWDRFAFVCDAPHHLCHQFSLAPYGSTWKAVEDTTLHNVFASTDPWAAPIQAHTGPDGAVWVLDWYNYLNNHNGICGTLGCGAGSAMNSSLRDTSRTRIYRVVYAERPLDPVLNLANASEDQLLTLLNHTNLLWRLHAQRLLLKRGVNAGLITKLQTLLGNDTVNDLGETPQVIHALRTLEGFGLFATEPATWVPVLKTLLLHGSPGVRWNAIDALPNDPLSTAAILDQGRINDPDAHVRIMALHKLTTLPGTKSGQMYTPYVTLDTYSQNRFNAVAGLTQSATLPPIPALRPTGVRAAERVFSAPLAATWRNGFFTLRGLGAGDHGVLTVRNARGALVARVAIRDGGAARGANLPAGAYAFRIELRDGRTGTGKLAAFP